MVFRRCATCKNVYDSERYTIDQFVCNDCCRRSPPTSPARPLSPGSRVLPGWQTQSPVQVRSYAPEVSHRRAVPVSAVATGPETVKVLLRKPGAASPIEVTIVKKMPAEQVTSYLRGMLGETPVAIGGHPVHPEVLCRELISGKEYDVVVESAPPAELPLTVFPASGTKYDVVIIGSGPGGEAAAVLASQLGARVAVLEKRHVFGGPTGLTSKAVRHAVKTIHTTSATLGGDKDAILQKLWGGFLDLLGAAQMGQAMETRGRLERNRAQLIVVDGVHISAGGTRVTIRRGAAESILQTKYVIVATGSRPARPSTIPFTAGKIVDAAEVAPVLGKRLPQSICILGGGIVAVEYALVLASVGVQTTMFTTPELFMRIVPEILRKEILAFLAKNNVSVVMDPVTQVQPGEQCTVTTGSTQYHADLILYSQGRDANSEGLGLEELGIKLGKYGRIPVNENFQTSVPNIFAIGDVIGGRLASVASKAGRAAAKFIFRGVSDEESPQLFAEKFEDLPLALWTVPEMASVGATEEELRAQGELRAEEGGKIVIGIAKYADLVQGRLAGGEGFVQLIAEYVPDGKKPCHRIIGASIFGAYANDLIQVAAMLIHSKSSLELVANTPWAAVTMSVLLQHAADDALFRSPYFHPSSAF